eukprot:TRINITY_DN1514_c1_g2_i3.p1 TRINITY_DN1514_c1_g2~~TRINITY_DN1514_c1_g2_i3.p1  ORF type:complete len:487 (+),score=134.93 TRINITY_DN1514_c1_g2_i3:108-1568(+)
MGGAGAPLPPRPVKWKWPWPWSQNDDKSETELPPVLLIPGIGGSILHAVNENGTKERIWVRLLNADREFRFKLWSKYNPETGVTESLDSSVRIEVPDDNHGLYSCDLLDPDILIPLDVVNYFHTMIIEMRKWGYMDGQTLFGFGYDFRQSNRLPAAMAQLKEKLKSVHTATGKKVTVITHSMGGLVLKSLLALHPQEFESHIEKWISIATPFHGAPGFIIDTLLTGVEFLKGWQKNLFIAKWSMHQLLVECPSVYELMADYEYEWALHGLPELRIVREEAAAASIAVEAAAEDGGDYSAKVQEQVFKDGPSVVSFLGSVLQDNKVDIDGASVPLPLSLAIVNCAQKTREILRTAKLPEGIKFFNIYGTGTDTPFHTRYGSEVSPIKQLSDILSTEAEFTCVDGDGTVPVESAMADGLAAEKRVGMEGEHRGLLRDDSVFRVVKSFLLPPHDSDCSCGLYDPITDCVLLPSTEEIQLKMEEEKYPEG